jgi:primosomal protein N'
MKNTLLAAAVIVVVVAGTYVNIIITFGPQLPANNNATGVDQDLLNASPIPPVEEIIRARLMPTEGDVPRSTFHTISEPPDIHVFQTQYKQGTQIVFNHKNHVEDFDLACIQCHHVEGCGKCHLKSESQQMQIASGKEALHDNCMGCHAEYGGPEGCDDCHTQ